MARPRTEDRCPGGHPFTDLSVKTVCEACGAGPIHHRRRKCVCAMGRAGIHVCRDCALAYDLVHHGSSKLESDDGFVTDGPDFREVVALVDRGRWVAMVGKLRGA